LHKVLYRKITLAQNTQETQTGTISQDFKETQHTSVPIIFIHLLFLIYQPGFFGKKKIDGITPKEGLTQRREGAEEKGQK